jgi:RNA polymerase sigma factor (TIGR02999 family)
MVVASRQELTLLLGNARAGDEGARGELVALVYDELRRVAANLMRRERPDHTLSPTAVVHEAVIRLLGEAVFDRAADRSFLFASAARSMREVLIDHARRRGADRRGGGRRRVPLDAVVDYFEEQGLDVVAVHEALDRLAELDGRQAQVMTLRYFGGMTVPEVATALGVSAVTVERDWRLARAWLAGRLGGGTDDTGALAPHRRAVRGRGRDRTRWAGGLAPRRLRRGRGAAD